MILAVEGMMMPMQARKSREDDTLLARVLHGGNTEQTRMRGEREQPRQAPAAAAHRPSRQLPVSLPFPHLKCCSLYLRPPKKKHMPAAAVTVAVSGSLYEVCIACIAGMTGKQQLQ
jgi:hypothetical protein